MIKENSKNVEPLCKDFWEQIKDTNPTLGRLVKKRYYGRRFYSITKGAEILAKICAGKFGAIDKKEKKGVYVEVLLEKYDKAGNKAIFDYLEKNTEIIENKLSSSLEWGKLNLSLTWAKGSETKRSKIFVHNKKFNPRDENEWENQYKWIIKTIEEFKSVFDECLRDM